MKGRDFHDCAEVQQRNERRGPGTSNVVPMKNGVRSRDSTWVSWYLAGDFPLSLVDSLRYM